MKMDAVYKKRTKKRRRTVISPDEIEKLEESFEKEQKRVVSGLPGALYSICCLGVSTILESEKIVTMWPTND